MHQSKLLEFLRSFSRRQLTAFRDFLESPYFNRSGDVLHFYEYIAAHGPAFKHTALKKATVLKRLRPEKPLTEKRLAYLMNQLLGLAEEFIAVETVRSAPLDLPFALVSALDRGALPRHFRSALEKARSALDDFPFRNADYFGESYRFQALKYVASDPDQHQQNKDLQEASDALDVYFIVEKLRYCWVMANFEYILNVHYDWKIGAWLLDYLEQKDTELPPAARIYHLGIQMTREPEREERYFQLKELLSQHAAAFNSSERKLLYTSLLNYCTRRINRFNDQAFAQEYLDINRSLLADGLLFEEGYLPPWRFLNLVNTGLRCDEEDWVRDFIEQYRSRLPADYADDISRTALGQYHYHRKDYKAAQIELNQTNPRDVLLSVTIRNLLTRIYFESNETELLLSFLEAYRIHLLRQDLLSEQMKQQARRFVDFTRKLTRIGRPEAKQLLKLKADLPAANEIYHRDWLEQQIERKMVEYKVK